jgi:hypothetical protein
VKRSLLVIGLGISGLISASLVTAPMALGVSHTGKVAGIVVGGTVTSTSGQEIGGEGLDLVAWPPDSVQSALHPGQVVPWKVLGSAVTAPSGSYSIGPVSASAMRPMMNGDFVNLDMLVVSGPGYASYNFPVRMNSTRSGIKIMTASSMTVNLRLRALPSNDKVVPSPDGHCQSESFFEKSLRRHNVVVGGMYSIQRGVNMKFTYLTGQQSELGVAVSGSGTFGAWHVGGHYESAKSVEQDYPVYHGKVSHVYITQFKYAQFEVQKANCTTYQQAHSTKFIGGALHAKVKPIKATFCAEYVGPGSGTKIDKNSAWTFSAGVNIKKVLDIDLSAQTGYDTETVASFHVITGSHYLCGNNTYPGDYPERAQWGERK